MSRDAIAVVLSLGAWNDVAASLGVEIYRSGEALAAMRADPSSDPDDIESEGEHVAGLQAARAAIVAAVRREVMA